VIPITPRKRKKKALMLACYFSDTAVTLKDHLDSFSVYSDFDMTLRKLNRYLPKAYILNSYDVLIIHFSLVISDQSHFSNQQLLAIRKFRGVKVMYIQDDYRWIYKTLTYARYLDIDAIFCLTPTRHIQQVYLPELLPKHTQIETVLAGYLRNEVLGDVVPYHERKWDVTYRARKVPLWIGKHTLQKWQIASSFLKDVKKYALNCDISYAEEDRLYGKEWVDFLRHSKAVLGTESGSSVVDFTGEIQKRVEIHLDSEPDTPFEELSKLYFGHIDGKITMNIVSPRVFEAISLKVLLILYPGEYSGVLIPGRHYLILNRDHSNMQEIVAVLRDQNKFEEIVNRAYQEIALNPKYMYKHMVNRFDAVSKECMEKKKKLSFIRDRATSLVVYFCAGIIITTLSHI